MHKTYSKKHGKGLTRENSKGCTPAAMEKYNRTMRMREVTWVLQQNFKGGKDAHVVFTYKKGNRPHPEKAKEDFAAALNILRKTTKKHGNALKYLTALGVGERGGIHMHMVTNCTDLATLSKAWPHGPVHVTPLYANGDFSGLAKYFVDQAKENGTYAVKIVGRWSCSRNLVRNPPREEKINRFSWREPPTPKKGYVIDIDSIDAGENPVTGIPHLYYRMIKIPPRTPPDKARELEKTNKEAVKNSWAITNERGRIQGLDAKRAKHQKRQKPVARGA